MKKSFFIVIIALLWSLGAAAVSGPDPSRKLPDVTIYDCNGQACKLGDKTGKILISHASWCKPSALMYSHLLKIIDKVVGRILNDEDEFLALGSAVAYIVSPPVPTVLVPVKELSEIQKTAKEMIENEGIDKKNLYFITWSEYTSNIHSAIPVLMLLAKYDGEWYLEKGHSGFRSSEDQIIEDMLYDYYLNGF